MSVNRSSTVMGSNLLPGIAGGGQRVIFHTLVELHYLQLPGETCGSARAAISHQLAPVLKDVCVHGFLTEKLCGIENLA